MVEEDASYIKAIAKFQLLRRLIPWRAKQACSPASPWQSSNTRAQQLSDEEEGGCCDEQRCNKEVEEDEGEGNAKGLCEAVGVGKTPC